MLTQDRIDKLQQQIDELEIFQEAQNLLFNIWSEISRRESLGAVPVLAYTTKDQLEKHLFGKTSY